MTDHSAVRDRALFRRLAKRDERAVEALTDLFHLHAPAALALALRVTRQSQLAEDVVQEVFLGLWRSPQGYQPDRGTVRAYLLTLVHHRAVDAVRREAGQRRLTDAAMQQRDGRADRADIVADEVAAREQVEEHHAGITAALTDLPDEQRRVVEMMYFAGKTQTAIAAELQCPLGTVKSRALLAMRKLRTALIERSSVDIS